MQRVRSVDKPRVKQQQLQRLRPNAVVVALATFVAVAALNLIASNSWISFASCPGTTDPILISTFPTSKSMTATTRKQRGDGGDDDPSFINMTNYNGPARVFPVYPYPFPCLLVPKSQAIMKTTPAVEGLFFQRPYKTGSTTMAGVVMRIARRKARQRLEQISSISATSIEENQDIPPLETSEIEYLYNYSTSDLQMPYFCQHRSNHGSAVNYRYAQRDVTRSFLMTLVRNPTKRVLSQFFHFGVSALRMEPTDPVFQTYLLSKMRPHPVLSDASLHNIPTSPDHPAQNLTLAVQNVLDGYDFIAVTERFDESLVALKMILNLDFADILYTRNRSGGSFTNGGDKIRPCIYVVPSFITPGMKRFFKSDKWRTRIRGEILLYQAASKSLDMTIDQLGRKEFTQQLAHFLRINKAAQARCEPREVGMCTASGEPVPIKNRTCIIWSEGCSDSCLDEMYDGNSY